MEVSSKVVGDVTVVQLVGEILNAQTSDQAKVYVLQLTGPTIILDMTGVPFMSSAGLRMLQILNLEFRNRGAKVLLVGLSENLEDTMRNTGFLNLFRHYATLEEGLADLASKQKAP
jgi:anti-sigma B factor antagonist